MKDYDLAFNIHLFVDNVLVRRPVMWHLPRLGDVLRLSPKKCAKVIDVCWCLDERSSLGQRVNICAEMIKEGKKKA